MDPQLLAVGRVARAHGVRGRVLIAPFNESSEGLERAPALWLGRPGEPKREYRVERAERAHLGYLVALRGVSGKDQADALRGCEVAVAREHLPSLDEGEFYAADLPGCAAVDAAGNALGTVRALQSLGPTDVLEVEAGGREVLVPLALVQSVDVAAKRVVIDVVEGLFDLEKADEAGVDEA